MRERFCMIFSVKVSDLCVKLFVSPWYIFAKLNVINDSPTQSRRSCRSRRSRKSAKFSVKVSGGLSFSVKMFILELTV